MTETNPWKTPTRRQSMKAVQPSITSNGVPYLQMRSVGSYNSTSGREERKGRESLGAVSLVNKKLWVVGLEWCSV